MSYYFETVEHKIFPMSGKVIYQNNVIKVRPKTLQLLILLIEGKGEIVSKNFILKTVWDDVQVDEQVIFQSIKELRKVFSGHEVIRTMPRKGYVWTATVEKLAIDDTKPNLQHKITDHKLLIILLTILIVVTSSYFLKTKQLSTQESYNTFENKAQNFTNSEQNSLGSIIILPFSLEIKNKSLQWLRYGGMDQLIHQLNASDKYGLMQTEDVLEVMQRGSVELSSRKRQDIERIFSVSGANLVVDVKLAGQFGDYQLIYSFHTRNNIKRGVVIQSQIEAAIEQLAIVINNEFGILNNQKTIEYHSDFAHQMLVLALEEIQTNNLESAINYLEATIEADSTNLIAHRLLGQLQLNLGHHKKAKYSLDEAFKLAELQGNIMEQGRISFWRAIMQMKEQKFDSALDTLRLAKSYTNTVKDWLYSGHIEEVMGKAFLHNNNFQSAEQHFKASIGYHQIIQCPYGHAQGLLNLVELNVAKGQYDEASRILDKSLAIIDNRHLDALEEKAAALKIAATR